MKIIKSHKELIVYQLAFKVSMEIFQITKSFPKEEVFSLTSQIRRSSSLFVQILQKLSGRGDMKRFSFQSFLIQKVKLQKLRFGLIILLNVNILMRQTITGYLQAMRELLECL